MALAAEKEASELLKHINAALRFSREALDLLPPHAVDDLASIHNQIGNIYSDARHLDRALPHYQHAIRYRERQGDRYGAAQTRFNVAIALANGGRLHDARLYAAAALQDFGTYGDRASDIIQETQQLLAQIDKDLNPTTPQ